MKMQETDSRQSLWTCQKILRKCAMNEGLHTAMRLPLNGLRKKKMRLIDADVFERFVLDRWLKHHEMYSVNEVVHFIDEQPTIKGEKKMIEIVPEKMNVALDDGAYMPERAHELDAGYDLRTPKDVTIYGGMNATIDTGVHIEIPVGYVGFLKSKSGLNVKDDITGEGVIDAGYTGSIKVKLYNNGNHTKVFYKGDKIIQLVILPIYTPELEQVASLEKTERGNAGFGSTGR